jgi:hypothetical protein
VNAKKRKQLRQTLERLDRRQLIALAVQKEELPYVLARTQTHEELVDVLTDAEVSLKPEPA